MGQAIKQKIRQGFLAERKSLSIYIVRRESAMVMKKLHFLSEYQNAKNIMVYFPCSNEINTMPLIHELLNTSSKRCYVPVIKSVIGEMKAVSLTKHKKLSVNKYGLPEPVNKRATIDPLELDVILIPGLAFTAKGERIGFGRGYYDRYLKKTHAKKVALAYDFQVVDYLPQNKNDVLLDIIITPSKIIQC